MPRKAIKIEKKPNYVVEDYRNPPKNKIAGYRRKKLASGHILNLAIMKGTSPKGGKTVVTSVWHPKTEKKSANPKVTKALKASRKKR